MRDRIEHRVKVELVEATAEVLGVDVSVVTDGLKNGDTLAEIANANGMDTDDVQDGAAGQREDDARHKVPTATSPRNRPTTSTRA